MFRPKDMGKDKQKPISSGNVELDSRLGGGLPVGSLVLIEGSSGSGKSVLSQQLLFGSLNQGMRVSLFTTENGVKSLISQMGSIDLDIFEYLLLGKLRAFPIELSKLGDNAPVTLVQAMKREYERGQNIVVVDSFTSAILNAQSDKPILTFFEECKRLCVQGATIILTLHAQAISDDLSGPIRSICDANLNLKSMQDGQRLVKTLEVAKIRGAASATGAIVGFEVEPGWGMRVIPISKARG